MRKKLIIAALVLVLIIGAWLLLVPWQVASYTNTAFGWPEEVYRTDVPTGCRHLYCEPGSTIEYFKKECLGVILHGPLLMDGPSFPSYCVGLIGDEWEERYPAKS